MIAFYVFLALASTVSVGVGSAPVLRSESTLADATRGLVLALMSCAFAVYFTVQALNAMRGNL